MGVQIKRRQAIFAGLAPLLPEEQTLAALELFDSSFSESSSFNLQSFVDRLYAQFQPPCARRDLHRALVQSVFLGSSKEDSWLTEANANMSPLNRLFTHMLSGLLERVAMHDAKIEAAIRTYLIDKLSALPLPTLTKRELVQWITHKLPEIGAPLTPEGARHLLNLAYVLVCEYLGPVVADRYLAETVRQSEGLPEARMMTPRSLL